MLTKRRIKHISPANKVNMGGFLVRQPLPTRELRDLDPFLLLHHAVVSYKDATRADQSGVGPHPHRGFSPVSFVFKGGVHHRDSLGNNSVVYEGGVQWINSGKGIIHSERPPEELIGSEQEQEFIQLWVNTPAAFKMNEPTYQGVSKNEIPIVTSSDKRIEFAIVAGEQFGTTGPVTSNTEVNAMMLTMQKEGVSQIEIQKGHVAFLYLLSGNISVNDETIEEKNMIVFENEGDVFELKAFQNSTGLFVSGAPIDEPIETYGPFVMNSQTEIMKAIQDAQNGKMGVLVEDF